MLHNSDSFCFIISLLALYFDYGYAYIIYYINDVRISSNSTSSLEELHLIKSDNEGYWTFLFGVDRYPSPAATIEDLLVLKVQAIIFTFSANKRHKFKRMLN